MYVRRFRRLDSLGISLNETGDQPYANTCFQNLVPLTP